MEESRRQAAIQLGLTPDQLKGLEAQAQRPGEERSDTRPVVPDARPLPEGDVGRYRWRQTPAEVEIVVPVDAGVRARDVAWSISQTHLTLGVKGREALKDAKLVHTVKLGGGHAWQLDSDRGQRCILATLEKKALHEQWPSVEAEPPASRDEAACELAAPAAAGKGAAAAADRESAKKELASVEQELEQVRASMAALRQRLGSLEAKQRELRAVVDGGAPDR